MPPRDELVLRYTSDGLDAAALVPGRDLVLDVPLRHGLVLPAGCALDDHIPLAERTGVDADAKRLAASWRAGRGTELTVEGVDLAFAWEVELFAGCFLAAARIRHGLRACLEGLPTGRVVATGFPPDLLAVVAAVVADRAEVVAADPRQDTPPRTGSRNSLISRALARSGVPGRIRSDVVAASYWPLVPVTRRLAARGSSLVPAAVGVALPGLDPRRQLRGLARGGWMGYPSAVARARSRRMTRDLLDRTRAEGAGLDDALHERAGGILREQATGSVAQGLHARAAFSRRAPRLVLVPFDSPAFPRVLLAEAHAAGASSLLVQHGFHLEPNDPDGSFAHHAAIWSEHDRARPLGGEAHVTGNPGAAHFGAGPPAGSARRRTIVLLEYTPRLSALRDDRFPLRHLQAALEGVAEARPDTEVVIRPHPSDPDPMLYPTLVPPPARLAATIDRTTPIEELFASADLCVGALSTASLQAAAVGLPVCVLNVSGAPGPWPLAGGDDGLPGATSAAELAERIPALLERGAGPYREAALEALGARANAAENVARLVRDLASR
jgi:hypothetical protein